MFRLVKRDRRRQTIALTPLGGILAVCLLVLAGSLIIMGWRGVSQSLVLVATPIPGPEDPFPITWQVEVKSGPPKGDPVGVVKDEGVAEQVKRHYLEAFHWLYESPQEADPSETARYFKDTSWGKGSTTYRTNIVAGTRQGVSQMQEMEAVPILSLGDRHLQVMNFSPDGRRVYLVDRQVEGGVSRWVERGSGEVVREMAVPPEVLVNLMVYDGTDGRWKIGAVETIPLPPGAETDVRFYERVWKGMVQ